MGCVFPMVIWSDLRTAYPTLIYRNIIKGRRYTEHIDMVFYSTYILLLCYCWRWSYILFEYFFLCYLVSKPAWDFNLLLTSAIFIIELFKLKCSESRPKQFVKIECIILGWFWYWERWWYTWYTFYQKLILYSWRLFWNTCRNNLFCHFIR